MSGTARRRRIATASVAALSSLALLTGGVDSAFGGDSGSFHPGAVSKHDRIVPGYGNGGYDVLSYDIHLHYNPDTGRLHGHTRIEAVATASLSRFHLDFVLPVGKVTVDGRRAKAASRRGPTLDYGGELVVTPKAGLPVGHQFTVVVRYDAHPADIKRQGYSSWSPTPTGSTAWNEPQSGPQWWYPSDDYPDDKATYDVTITAPKEDTAVSNGVLVSRRVHGGQATAHWSTDVPMATYLTFLTIGRYDVRQMTTRDGIPAYFAFERGGGKTARRARHFVSQTPRVIRFLERRLGPYPFPVTGAILERTKYATAFETQTRVTYAAPLFASDRQVPGITNVVHETAHQWFGDDVTAARWGDIWLAEGFASYAQWLWSAAHHKGSVEHHFKATYQRRAPGSDWWHTPVVDNVDALALQGYRRGAMSLEALRNVVGSRTFFAILRTYLERYRYSSVTTADFTDVAEELSPTPLGRFFQVWLYSKHRPNPTVRNGFPAGFPGSVP